MRLYVYAVDRSVSVRHAEAETTGGIGGAATSWNTEWMRSLGTKHARKAFAGATVVLILLTSACTGETPSERAIRFAGECGSGFQLCADEGLIEATLYRETCEGSDCTREPFADQDAVFLEIVELDAASAESCGPGDCGARASALRQGWNPGRWKITAPPYRDLIPPDPVTIELVAGEVVEIELVYETRSG